MNKKQWLITIFLEKNNILEPMPKIKYLLPFELSEKGARLLAEKIVNDKYENCVAYYLECLG